MDPVGKSEIPDLLHAADIGLHVLADVELFRTAVSPNKVFDYMAASLVTVTNCPGLVSDLVQRSGGGLGVGPTKLAFGLREVSALSPHERLSLGIKEIGRASCRERVCQYV